MSKNKSVVILKDSINRLVKDVKDIMKNPLHDNGIYYKHDDSDMLKAKAMIIGQEGTPYFGGYYFFDITFPAQYPYSPPKFTYCTNGDGIRFNPNLYINGKVCLSVLNTWTGEQWSSCQTIRSVLLALSTILCNDPLLNEPGVTPNHCDMLNYNTLIEYKNIEIAILFMLKKSTGYYPSVEFDCFEDVMIQEFQKNMPAIEHFLKDKIEKTPLSFTIKLTLYSSRSGIQLDYSKLYQLFQAVSLTISVPNEIAVEA